MPTAISLADSILACIRLFESDPKAGEHLAKSALFGDQSIGAPS
jgi:hypothetical protein